MGLPATRKDLELIRQDCLAMVKKRAMLSAGATVLPLPGADVGADIALLMDLLPAINRKFGLSAEQIETLDPHIKKVILVTVTSVGSQFRARGHRDRHSSGAAASRPARCNQVGCSHGTHYWPACLGRDQFRGNAHTGQCPCRGLL